MDIVITPEDRIKELGLKLPMTAPALGHYEPWCIVGNTFMTSGQFPWIDGDLKYRGRLGKDINLEQGYDACRLAALNAISQLKSAVDDLSKVSRIFRIEGVLNVAEGVDFHPKALDGASDIINFIFSEYGRHTRMIWTNPVMPMNSVCLVYIFAEICKEPSCCKQQ